MMKSIKNIVQFNRRNQDGSAGLQLSDEGACLPAGRRSHAAKQVNPAEQKRRSKLSKNRSGNSEHNQVSAARLQRRRRS